jgi:hypothetical protein
MKKAGIILTLVSAMFLNGYSQNVDDALRYSQIFYSGTARFMSMGGAFTALGGDLSSISLNPAGTGVFRSSEISLSSHLLYNKSTSLWNSNSSSDFRYTFNLGQIGVVSNIITTGNETGLISLNAAYSYNRINNYNENTTISGISDNSSMADYWSGQAQGIYYKDLRGGEGIAYDAYVIDTTTNGSSYATVFSQYNNSNPSTYGQTIRRVITNDGYIGEHAFSVGGNFSNKFFFGATLGINRINYNGHYQHHEFDGADNTIFDFKSFSYINSFTATGTGVSFKLGTIIKPVDFLRVGMSIHSPVIYRISETFYDNIQAFFDNEVDPYGNENPLSGYKYTFTTPFRANFGVALQVKKLALISADYEFVDYRMARFSRASDGYDYYDENQSIKDILRSTSNLRLGAEVRLGGISLRGGYSYYGKSFNANEDNKDLDYSGLSFGIGTTRLKNFYFDLSYTILSGTSKYYMYNDPGFLDAATIESVKSTFGATMGFKF